MIRLSKKVHAADTPSMWFFARCAIFRALPIALCLHASPGNAQQADPEGWIKCVDEGGVCQLTGNNDVAYGARGKFAYKINVNGSITFNNATFGDPIPGVVKAGYYKANSADWTACTTEGGTCILTGSNDIAYGANGRFAYRFNISGSVTFNNAVFGDPAPGVPKSGYFKPASPNNWLWCAREGEICALAGNHDLAFGNNGTYNYKSNLVGPVTYNNATFGDPLPGVQKVGYYRMPVPPAGGNGTWQLGTLTNNSGKPASFGIPLADASAINGAINTQLQSVGIAVADLGVLSIVYKGHVTNCPHPFFGAHISWGERSWEFYFDTGTRLDIVLGANGTFTFNPGFNGQVVNAGQPAVCR